MIEKHFTLDRDMPGPDHKASLVPSELKAMVRAIDDVSRCLGTPEKAPTAAETINAKVARRGLVATRPIGSGERLSAENVAARRPDSGRSPMEFWDLIGQLATRDYRIHEPID